MGKDLLVERYLAKEALSKLVKEPRPATVHDVPISIKLSCGASAFFSAFYGSDISKTEAIKTQEQIIDEISAMSPQAAQELLLSYINSGVGPGYIDIFNVHD